MLKFKSYLKNYAFVLQFPEIDFLMSQRLPFTVGFVGSMVATIYVSMVLHSYILSVFFSVLQVLALAYYAISYFPGGSAGMKFLSSALVSSVLRCFGRWVFTWLLPSADWRTDMERSSALCIIFIVMAWAASLLPEVWCYIEAPGAQLYSNLILRNDVGPNACKVEKWRTQVACIEFGCINLRFFSK